MKKNMFERKVEDRQKKILPKIAEKFPIPPTQL
jgi:hypothetical protein